MPQMAPMNWMSLFLVFFILLIIVINKIYFLEQNYSNNINSIEKSKMKNYEIKWMW